MKNLKNIKKILILLLAIVTVFTMSGITSYAETRPFGGIDVDLDLYENTVRGADDSFITDLTNAENVVFTNNEELDINLSIRNGLIYGTPSNPIKKEYDSNIKLEHASTFTFNWGTQQLRTLEPLTFVNKVPESINVPVPFYFEEGEQAGSWIFNETKPNELSESTKINVQNLHSLMKENNYTYTYNSGTLHYSPGVKYIASNGTELTSSNNAAWHFEVPMNVKYTVDIKPVTAGGTPTIGGNNTPVDVPKISEVNKEFFRNGNINTYENDYTAPEGTTDQALLNYGDSYNVATNPIDESIVVMSTNATVADPLTGEGSQATSVGVVGGQTSIEVAYGKNVAFTKVDENGDSIAGAEFTVYDGNSVIGSATSDNAGTVNLPTLRMPKLGENVTYTMRETKTPEGYVENEAVYTITIDDKGNATIEGDGAENGKIVNYKPVTITKTSNPDSGEYVKKDQKIDYILTVENTSDKVRDIIVTDQLPEEVKYDTSKPYTIIDQNGEVTTGNHWNGSWTGQIDAKTTLTIIIPTVVTKEYDPVNMEENIITNQASLKAKKIIGNTDEYEKEQFTEEVTHYIAPEVSYTMNKVRVTEPKDGLKGFVAGAGEVIEYKVTFENTGELGLDIDLNDVFENADYFTFVDASEASIRLEKGETKTVTFKATVNEGTPASDDKGYLNTVTSEGTATYTDPESGNDVTIDKTTQKDLEQTSTANTPVIVVKDPTITKTSDPESGSTVAKGDKITYTLTVENPYDVEREIVVTDNLPGQVKADGKYTVNGVEQDQAWDGSYEGTIEANGKLVIEIPVEVIKAFDETNGEVNVIKNQASLKAKDVLTDEYGDDTPTEEVTHYITPKVSYTMNKVRVTKPKDGLKGFVAGAGEVIEYKVTFENTGDLGLDIDLNDIFENADYFTFVEASEASIRLEKGETKTVTFKATVNEGTPASDDKGYLNTVTSEGTATYTDPESGNDVTIDKTTQKDLEQTSTANTPVIVVKDPTITKTSDPESGSTVAKGDKITYTLTVENPYDVEREIVVTDNLPGQVKADGKYTVNGVEQDQAWDGSYEGTIEANGKLVIEIPVEVIKAFDETNGEVNVIKNQASLKAKDVLTDEYGDDTPTEEVTHYITPKVSYTMNKVRVTKPKDGLKGFVAGAGEVIEYKVTFENTGDLGLDIDLNDVFENADYFTFVEASEASIRLEKGETKTVTFKATVNEGTPASDDKGYLNTVTSEGTATYTDPESGNDVTIDKNKQKDLEQTSTANTPVIVVKDPTITKTSDPESGSTVAKGDKITYTLTVENPYDVEREIVVTDNLPGQVKADGKYTVNGVEQDQTWNGSYEGTIEANGKLVIEIPVEVIKAFDETNSEVNVIKNQASLKAKDVLTGEDGDDTPTEEVTHYITPKVSYTMNKERVTKPKDGLKGFYAGTGEVIDYKVTLVNTGDITLNIDLEDIFVDSEYFEFVGSNQTNVTIEPGESKEVIFQATINANTPVNADYENIVTSIANGSYVDAETGEVVLVDENNWPDGDTSARLEDNAFTPVIAPEVTPVDPEEPAKPEKPGVDTGDNSSIALFGSLAIVSGLGLILKRKKED